MDVRLGETVIFDSEVKIALDFLNGFPFQNRVPLTRRCHTPKRAF